ncbi:hypothetical protein OLEAN_C08570 [Oleispira antarctica RB-8]|uniref:Uncharacterized protein n=1 Tax=Oleispira antarctica RB-8 TaxID=698738 RepID=R4YPB1_OLEAN|nr:hypothetical protein OLEAN_C08570 [Oleispira antarctica RB-8]
MKNTQLNIPIRRLDAIEIAALEPMVKAAYLKRLKIQRPNLFEGVLRLVTIEETRLLVNKAKASGQEDFVIRSINNAMEKAEC